MAAEPPAPPLGRTRRAPRLSRTAKIGLGLLLTLVGIACFGVLLPTAPSEFTFALPVALIGILALWVGGILMGIGSRS